MNGGDPPAPPDGAATAFLLLEDGTRFDGVACGGAGMAVGDVVFTTAMGGYQETVTAPSAAGQLVAFTTAEVGACGVAKAAMESDRIAARAVIMRAASDGGRAPRAEGGWLEWLAAAGIPAIDGVDTRALARHLRTAGTMRGGLFPAETATAAAAASVAAEPPLAGRDLIGGRPPVATERLAPLGDGPASGLTVALIDTGAKRSLTTALRQRGATVERHGPAVDPQTLLAGDPDAIVVAGGPGDPAMAQATVATVAASIGRRPLFGIGLGHQLVCRALGLETFPLRFGHRGANHPVKELSTGRIEITSQSHGFAVCGPDGSTTVAADRPTRWESPYGAAAVTHVSCYDQTIEGVALCDLPVATVQFDPGTGPGPRDARHLLDRFLAEIAGA